MKNLAINGNVYNNIFKYNDKLLLKYSSKGLSAWEHLMKKDMSYANLPVDIFQLTSDEKKEFPTANSKILLPYYDNYKSFTDENFTKNLRTKDILDLYLKHIEILKDMQLKDVYFCDLHSSNIMLNENFDIKFIDYDLCIVDDIIEDNVKALLNYDMPISELKNKAQLEGKKALLKIYLNYLSTGSFKPIKSLKLSLLGLRLDDYSLNNILKYLDKNNKLDSSYYLEDIILHLKEINYESPSLSFRKYM